MSELAAWIVPRVAPTRDGAPRACVAVERRVPNLMLVADMLGTIRTEIVPNYRDGGQPLDDVGPFDTGCGLVYWQMDPEETRGRMAKAAAKAIAREGVAAQVLNIRQETLRQRSAGWGELLADAAVYVLRRRKDRSALLAECAKRARLTAEEIKNIQQRLDADERREQDSR
jgi:hypothetical protein